MLTLPCSHLFFPEIHYIIPGILFIIHFLLRNATDLSHYMSFYFTGITCFFIFYLISIIYSHCMTLSSVIVITSS